MQDIVSEISISYKNVVKPGDRILIDSADSAAQVFLSVYDTDKIGHKETMFAMYLNSVGQALAVLPIGEGGLCGVVCDPKIIFQGALKTNASRIILCHNHPSGDARPSASDVDFTKKIEAGGVLLDLPLLDHIILTPDGDFYSFSSNEKHYDFPALQ